MKIKLVIIISLITFSLASAQEYKYAVGLRGGASSGVTFRKYIDENSAYFGILGGPNESFKATLLIENYSKAEISISNNFYYVTGYGAHIGFNYSNNYTFFGSKYYLGNKVFSPILGVDGLLGIEYRFTSFPIIAGINYKPFFEFSTTRFFHVNIWDIGFYVSYKF